MTKIRYLLNWLTLLLFVILISGCTTTGKVTEQRITNVIKESDGKIEDVYFCPRDDCEAKLADFIMTAEEYVDCAFYELDLEKVILALKDKKNTGAKVRVVIDGDNYEEINNLSFVNYENKSSFMHNKFCVIDGQYVSTGSFNPTYNGANKNNNNLIILSSLTLAANYETEFEELWRGEYGKGNKTEMPVAYLNGSKVENYFCPEDNCGEKITEALKKAEKSIYFLTFSFTHTGIANAIVIKMQDGIEVKGVFDNKGITGESSKFDLLKYQGADIRKDFGNMTMHHKVFIIDNMTVITGSFNPSANADERNDENVLIIQDRDTAEKYLNEFKTVWEIYSKNEN